MNRTRQVRRRLPLPWQRTRSRRFSVPLNQNAEGAAAVSPAHATSIATLLASHVLRDGEVVLLILKPSFWFIIFNSAVFTAIVIIASIALAVLDHRAHDHFYFETSAFFIAGRFMWSILQWMGRLYILTDMRILRLTGVFNVDIFDCPLRKVVRTRIVTPIREKLVATGSIEIIPKDEQMPTAIWQTIRKPALVHEKILVAINRARQSGMGSD